VWYFRDQLFADVNSVLFKFLVPLLGGILLALVFVKTTIGSWDPAYGTGSSVFGVGSVFVIGVGLLLIGVVLMLWWRVRSPAFFRGQVLQHRNLK
jgi:hypothetical protein